MANLYSTTVGATTFGANALTLNANNGGDLVNAQPLTDLGTPQLRPVKFSIAGVDMSTTPLASGSNLQKLISVVQATGGEIYYVGAFTNANPSVGVMLMTNHSLNSFNTDNTTEGFGKLETAVDNAISGATATITTATHTGLSFT